MNTLFVILGPTGVGKTDLSIEVARMLGTSVISCDSRQIYRELSIGVASPSPEQLAAVKHYFIATRSVEEHYSAGQYELDALPIIESEIAANGCAVMVGGSMLYIDAVCRGIDDIPTIDEELRRSVRRIYDEQGIEEVRRRLRLLDPQHYAEVDLRNVKRMLHALEVCYQTGQPFSKLRTGSVKRRSFDIVKIGLDCPREVRQYRPSCAEDDTAGARARGSGGQRQTTPECSEYCRIQRDVCVPRRRVRFRPSYRTDTAKHSTLRQETAVVVQTLRRRTMVLAIRQAENIRYVKYQALMCCLGISDRLLSAYDETDDFILYP